MNTADLLAIQNPEDAVQQRRIDIRESVLRDSTHLDDGNFTVIHPDDLECLFNCYDDVFFKGWLGRAVTDQTDQPLRLRFSPRATRAGGKTIVRRTRAADGATPISYEIAVANRLLFMTFGDIERPVVVTGHTCRDRLDALQCIMEHEIIHLAELLVWKTSSCKNKRFRTLAGNIFDHTGFHHDLVTPHEDASVRFGIKPGSEVAFDYEGQRLVGRVNRIHRRATVLVEAADGVPYGDGRRYHKYYIPLTQLALVSTE